MVCVVYEVIYKLLIVIIFYKTEMAYINFVIPGNKSDLLLTSVSGEYSVNNVTGVKELPSELRS